MQFHINPFSKRCVSLTLCCLVRCVSQKMCFCPKAVFPIRCVMKRCVLDNMCFHKGVFSTIRCVTEKGVFRKKVCFSSKMC